MGVRTDRATSIAIFVGIGLVGFLAFRANRAVASTIEATKKAVGETVTAVNPADPGNLLNRGITASIEATTGSKLSFGQTLFRLFNPVDASALCRSGQTEFCTNHDLQEVRRINDTAEISPPRLIEGSTSTAVPVKTSIIAPERFDARFPTNIGR